MGLCGPAGGGGLWWRFRPPCELTTSAETSCDVIGRVRKLSLTTTEPYSPRSTNVFCPQSGLPGEERADRLFPTLTCLVVSAGRSWPHTAGDGGPVLNPPSSTRCDVLARPGECPRPPLHQRPSEIRRAHRVGVSVGSAV